MAATMGKAGAWALAGTLVAGGPMMAACSTGPTYEQWAATDGAAGRINLDDVQEAFKSAKSASDFEQRVNQIYEGDGLVLIRAKQEPEGLSLEGWEDLDGNYEISDTQDDLLFTILERNDQHEMRGYGANSYYHSGFGAGNFLFTYLLISSLTPRGYYYTTPPTHARTTMTSQRDSYRSSSRYRSQVSRNSNYFSTQKRFAGSRYDNAGRNISTSRQSYLGKQQSSGAFKKSSTGVRSSWGKSTSAARSSSFGSSRGGFFRGGGGAQRLIGLDRFAPPA